MSGINTHYNDKFEHLSDLEAYVCPFSAVEAALDPGFCLTTDARVCADAKLSADGINKGANETGIRRYRSFARHAERLGYTVRYIKNSVHGLTEDELNALVGA